MPTTKDHFRVELDKLIHKFQANLAEYMSPDYSEAQVRHQFIDPFFTALGWDFEDKAGLGPNRCEVWTEKGETSGKPDYNFRIDGQTKFFAEAKAPHVTLSTKHVMQSKKYAWNTQTVSFAVLTDFEGIRLYDAREKPDEKHADRGLVFKYRFDQYLTDEAVDKIWLLSRDAVAAGSLDGLVRGRPPKNPLDKAFLADLTEWRTELAKDAYKNVPGLDVQELNEAVQVFLDRLIFVQIAQDRHIMESGGLKTLLEQWREGKHRSLRAMLDRIFEQVNEDLNGEIFKPNESLRKAVFTDSLVAKILRELCDGPYDFSVIGVELLGSIYERYLGKTIRVTPAQVHVEDKPAVRKAGGVYYMAKYIVDYIVENTVGKLIEGKTPKQIAKLRILDPACGSGSFLLGAYQKLIDYHVAWYTEHPREARGCGSKERGSYAGDLFPCLVEEESGRKRRYSFEVLYRTQTAKSRPKTTV